MGGGSTPLYCQRTEAFQRASSLYQDAEAQAMAAKYGLQITNTSWEDCGRFKFSNFGPFLGNLSVVADGFRMPLIRNPNFADFSWDVPMASIPLVFDIGNPIFLNPFDAYSRFVSSPLNRPGELRSVPLNEVLRNIKNVAPFQQHGLLAPTRDSHAVVTSQAALLPVGKSANEKTVFNLELHAFGTSLEQENAAVLVILVTAHGSSVQILTAAQGADKRLWHNAHGLKCPFVGIRLESDRLQRGVFAEGVMTSEERRQNVVLVIQVPLTKAHNPVYPCSSPASNNPFSAPTFASSCFSLGSAPSPAFGVSPSSSSSPSCSLFGTASASPAAFGANHSNAPSSSQFFAFSALSSPALTPSAIDDGFLAMSADGTVEPAIVSVGEAQGLFPHPWLLSRYRRDERYPVRVTVQWYLATSTGAVEEAAMAAISKKMKEAQTKGDFFGSLVSQLFSGRPTEGGSSTASPPSMWTAPPAAVAYTCDGCYERVRVGALQYRCTVCPDYDLCEKCCPDKHSLLGPIHYHDHLMLRIDTSKMHLYGRNLALWSRRGFVHMGVKCDVCGTFPIVGIRYRCTICPDFDMCERCEAREGHADFQHPLLKIVRPETAPTLPAGPPIFGAA